MAVLDDLLALPPDLFTSQYIFEAVPYVFGGDLDDYVAWKTELGARLEIDPRAICVVGSAGLGISLNPENQLRAFKSDSDVDVAVVSHRHFEIAWHHLRQLGVGILDMGPEARNALRLHRERHIFDGTIATDFILALLPFAQQWVPAFAHMAGIDPTAGREVRARIYRDFDALRLYQRRGVVTARAYLEEHKS